MPVLAQSLGYNLGADTFDTGGGTLGDPESGYALRGVSGQPDAQVLDNGRYTLQGGFLGPQQAAAATATPVPTRCPVATPEPFFVEPVTSPTGSLTQTILVDSGNIAWVEVSTISGIFTTTVDLPGRRTVAVPIDLLPNTTHELLVRVRVRVITSGGCDYGGYVLSTTTDRNGTPLVIVQQSDTPTPTATNTPNVPELTATAGGATLTPTRTNTPTATPTATNTPGAPELTATAGGATLTPTRTNTPTATPTATTIPRPPGSERLYLPLVAR
jgi:hypothetical protein